MREAIQTLDEAGHVAYVVGGSVRDFLLGSESKDHDIATSAGPDELVGLFPNAVTVGKAFGVIKVPVNVEDSEAPVLLEIATFREDLEYRDHRHPTGVRFSGPEEDAERRDFTINALFYDAKTSRILDTVGGLEDLRGRVLRAIGDPHERFREDALRLLRAVRFSARLGFPIEPATDEAIRARAKLIAKVSAERVRDELTLMWTGPRPAQALQSLAEHGLLEHVLPELEQLRQAGGRAQPWARTLKALETLTRLHPKRSATLAWATLLLETASAAHASQAAAPGSPAPAKGAVPSADAARAIAARMRMSREEIERIAFLVEAQPKFREAFNMREATLQRFVRQAGMDEALALHGVDAISTDGNLVFHEFCKSRLDALLAGSGQTPRLLAGNDLIQLGLAPGREFSEILRVVEDLALEKKLRTKEEALEYVVRNFVK